MAISTNLIVFENIFVLTIKRVVICIDSVSCKKGDRSKHRCDLDCCKSWKRQRIVRLINHRRMSLRVIRSKLKSLRHQTNEEQRLPPMILIRKKQQAVLDCLRVSRRMIGLVSLSLWLVHQARWISNVSIFIYFSWTNQLFCSGNSFWIAIHAEYLINTNTSQCFSLNHETGVATERPVTTTDCGTFFGIRGTSM